MFLSVQRLRRQDLVVATIGGTLVPNWTHRDEDVIPALFDALSTLASLHVADRNLASMADDARSELASTYPDVFTDTAVILPLAESASDALITARDAVWDALESVVGEADCWLDSDDGIGVYPIEADDLDD
jgi:hypothetical protein